MLQAKRFCGAGVTRLLAAISLLCLLWLMCAVPTAAVDGAAVTVSSCTVERGSTAAVSLDLSGNPGIWGIKLRVHYNHSILTLNAVTAGNVFEKGEMMLSADLNKNPYIIVANGNELENKTANGAVVTLHFTVDGNAAFGSYPVTVEVSQVNNVNGDRISVAGNAGSVTVAECVHANQEWRVTKPATCEENGTETLTCKKCGATFNTRSIGATNHPHTEVRGAVAASTTKDGYTGDTYCTDCGKLLSAGQTIPKTKQPSVTTPSAPTTTETTTRKPPKKTEPSSTTAEPPATEPEDTTDREPVTEPNEPKPDIIQGSNSTYQIGSDSPLVFVSNADFADFLGVEIDGKALDRADYTAVSGSTVVTVSADYLKRLSPGEHTVSILSSSGTATATFTVEKEAQATDTETAEPKDTASADAPSDNVSYTVPVIIITVGVVLVIGGIAVFVIMKKRRG